MNSRRIRTTAVAALVLALALALAACGSSSSSTATSATSSASASTKTAPGTGGAGGFSGRISAFRTCMSKQGITLPQRKPGQGGGGGLLGGGAGTGTGTTPQTPQLPAGVSKAQYEAALKKCAALRPKFGPPGAGGANRLKSPLFTAALTKFAACMNTNGIKLPAPNTSGKGPVFNTTGINTASTQFKTAEAKCAALLRSGFQRGGGTRENAAATQAG